MNKVKHFFELKELWKKASEEERDKIDKEVTSLLDSMTDEENEALTQAISDDFQQIHQSIEALERTFSARKLMKPVLPFISVSALAKEYFGKSSSWFYQRLNGNTVHGKQVSFTEDELKTLSHALSDMAAKLQQAAATMV